VDEFQSIARLFRPLTNGAAEAFDLRDDAAAIASRPGYDLIVTQDAMVEGVHFLADDPAGLIARKLLRVNLSDLAAKGAEPYAYFLTVAWPRAWNDDRRTAFVQGLGEDQAHYGLTLLGGDTVSTPGPLTLSVTMMGWTPRGAMIRRAGAMLGDVVMVSGTIGDGALGLRAAQGDRMGLEADAALWLADRFHLPQPRIDLQPLLRTYAAAAADVSDGLLADAGHIGEASGLGVEIDLGALPLSKPAAAWLARQPDRAQALAQLAAGGDDYEVVCTIRPDTLEIVQATGLLTPIGRTTADLGVQAILEGRVLDVARLGFSHP
jgi:thiamine-monophosphate kinase